MCVCVHVQSAGAHRGRKSASDALEWKFASAETWVLWRAAVEGKANPNTRATFGKASNGLGPGP